MSSQQAAVAVAVKAAEANAQALIEHGGNGQAPAAVRTNVINNAIVAANAAAAAQEEGGPAARAANNAAQAAALNAAAVAPTELRKKNSPLVQLLLEGEYRGQTRNQLRAARPNLVGQFRGNVKKPGVRGGGKTRRLRR